MEEWRKYSRFTFVEKTISNSPKIPRAKFLGSDRLFCFISICKVGSSKNPSALFTSLSELSFKIQKIYSVGTNEKSDFYKTMAAAQAAENHADERGLT